MTCLQQPTEDEGLNRGRTRTRDSRGEGGEKGKSLQDNASGTRGNTHTPRHRALLDLARDGGQGAKHASEQRVRGDDRPATQWHWATLQHSARLASAGQPRASASHLSALPATAIRGRPKIAAPASFTITLFSFFSFFFFCESTTEERLVFPSRHER